MIIISTAYTYAQTRRYQKETANVIKTTSKANNIYNTIYCTIPCKEGKNGIEELKILFKTQN